MNLTIGAVEPDDAARMRELRRLLLNYANHLNSTQGTGCICLAEYQAEVDTLPFRYRQLLLAENDGAACGCVLLKNLNEEDCEVKRLWVEPAFRGQKLGRLLMERALNEARTLRYRAVYLDTIASGMTEAVRLYRKLGFQCVDRYNDNDAPGVEFFRLSLEQPTR